MVTSIRKWAKSASRRSLTQDLRRKRVQRFLPRLMIGWICFFADGYVQTRVLAMGGPGFAVIKYD